MARGRLSPLLMPRLDTIEDTAMEVTAMVDTVVAMVATVDTMARDLLMPRPLLMLSLATGTTAMDTVMDTAMVAMDMVVVMEAMAMVDTVVDMADTVATTARDLLMLRPSPAMVTTAMDTVMDMAMAATVMAVAMDTTDK